MSAADASWLNIGALGAARVLVIGHRGAAAVAPENTLAAFDAALDAGADLVELDARMSADGTLYCLHDALLDRTTDAVRVLGRRRRYLARTADADVARLDAGAWFDARFAGQRVPTLAGALERIGGRGVALVEHKAGPAEAYARLLARDAWAGRVVVQSFDWAFLDQVHAAAPSVPLAALGRHRLDEPMCAALAARGIRAVAWRHGDLRPEAVDACRRHGLALWAWTANGPAAWARLRATGVDGMITDDPAALRAWLAVLAAAGR